MASTSHMMNSKDLQELRALPGNTRCIDCDRSKPEWASVTFGIFMCLDCSGPHRSLGTHISFVRSVKMDSWTDIQIKRMKISGGNTACREFLSSQGITISTSFRISKTTSTSIQNKYRTPQGQLYQQILDARMEGKPEPTELLKVEIDNNAQDKQDNDNSNNNNNNDKKKEYNAIRSPSNNNNKSSNQVGGAVKIMEGFGSDPHPSEKLGSEKPKRVGDRRGRKMLLGVSGAVGMAITKLRHHHHHHHNKNKNAGSSPSTLSGTV